MGLSKADAFENPAGALVDELAELFGDLVTLHNVRNFDYRTMVNDALA